MSKKVILGFESSCDETAVAAVDEHGHVLSERILSQIDTHKLYGGVVPEVASRSHFKAIDKLAAEVLADCQAQGCELTAIAATQGPGLIGALLVGSSYAQGLALGYGLPFIGVHHLRGHLASALLQTIKSSTISLKERANEIFPALVLLVSGGHTQILAVDESLRAQQLVDTVDDAAGECFDKSAKLMGLSYPGGPAIEKLAQSCSGDALQRALAISKKLPRPKTEEGDFSFSGLKTAIRTQLSLEPTLRQTPEFCWAIQESIADTLLAGLSRAFKKNKSLGAFKHLVFCGGVSANQHLRSKISAWATERGLQLMAPPLKYCTDNAAMICTSAWVQAKELGMTQTLARTPLELGH